ncbi:MAG: hypothetical protein IPO92_10915 [Saprospiraceae bacterium]|nr:hypothetical protein [Saprospiraceae bacterium]
MYRWIIISTAFWSTSFTAQIDSLVKISNQYAEIDHKQIAVNKRITKPLSQLGFPARKYNLFSSGELDFISDGLLRSSAKVIEINIGDPDKFFIPLYVMIGATSATNQKNWFENKLSAIEILNNKGGLFGIGIDGSSSVFKIGKNTEISVIYQFSGKSVNSVMLDTEENVSIFSKIIASGLRLDTKAWKNDQTDAPGNAWIKGCISYSINDKDSISNIFGPESASNFVGSNIEGGIDIQDFMAIKIGYYKYLNNQNMPIFQDGFYIFSADFNISQD